MNSRINRSVVIKFLLFFLIIPIQTFSLSIAPANAVTVTATDTLCNQEVGNATNVTAARVDNDCVVTFKNVGTTTWTVPAGITSISALVVGGGGGGGADAGSGGGGGGGYFVTNVPVTAGSYSLTVGAGGTGNIYGGAAAVSGSNSSLTIGTSVFTGTGGAPGSIGKNFNPQPTNAAGGTGTGTGGTALRGGASGQGAGWINTVSTKGFNGSDGFTNGITGTNVTYGGGGAGGSNYGSGTVAKSIGGAGGGGDSGYATGGNQFAATAGAANTGGGGGSGMSYSSVTYKSSASGGSGIVIIRYSLSGYFSVTYNSNQNQYQNGATTGTVPTTQSLPSGSSVTVATQGTLARKGFEFAGWNTKADGTGTSYVAGTGTFNLTSSVTLYAQWTIPASARLIGSGSGAVVSFTNPNNVANGSLCVNPVRGMASDGTDIFYRTSTSGNYICKATTGGIVLSANLVTSGTANVANLPIGDSHAITYSHGCIFIRATGLANDALYCISTSDWKFNSVATPSGKGFYVGMTWLQANLIDFPDGRIGAVSAPNQTLDVGTGSGQCPAGFYCKVLRLYKLTGTGASVSVAFDEDIVLADTVNNFPNDDHGIATDGTYLYQVNWSSGYKVYALSSGSPSYLVFDGFNGTAPCTASSGKSPTFCPINNPVGSGATLGNSTYLSRVHGVNSYTIGDYTAAKFWLSAAIAPPPGPGSTPQWTITYAAGSGASGSAESQYVSKGSSVTLRGSNAGFTKTGSDIIGWSTTSGGAKTNDLNSSLTPSNDVTLYPVWGAKTYTISYSYGGATGNFANGSDTYTSTAINLPIPTRTGYTFGGWSTSVGGSAVSNPYSPTSNITLYALWTRANVTITYNSGAVSKTMPSQVSSTYGAEITLASPDSPITDGSSSYEFSGWKNSDGKIFAGNGTYLVPTSDSVLTAQWAVSFEGHYVPNGGAPDDGNNYLCNPSPHLCGDGDSVNLPSLTRVGFDFDGWVDSSNVATGDSVIISSTKYIFSAKWKPKKFKITYNPNNGSANTSTSPDPDFNTFVTLPSAPTKGSLQFLGWSDGNSTYGAGSQFLLATADSLLFTAQWAGDVYTINYDWGAGVTGGSTDPGSFSTGGDGLTLPDVGSHAKPGYYFAGWSTTTSSANIVSSPYTPSGNGTLTAIWLQNPPASLIPTSQNVSATSGSAITPTQTINPSDFSGTVTFTISPSLPTGLTLNSATGVITGTPTSSLPATTYTITGTAGSDTATSTLILTISNASSGGFRGGTSTPPTFQNTNIGNLPSGVPFNSGPLAPGATSYQVSSGSIPAGLTFDPKTGILSGTPTNPGPYSFTITAFIDSASTAFTFSGNIAGTNSNANQTPVTNQIGGIVVTTGTQIPSNDPVVSNLSLLAPTTVPASQIVGNPSVFESGKQVPAQIVPNSTNTGLLLNADGWGLTLTAAKGSTPQNVDSRNNLIIKPNVTFSTSGTGFAPLSIVKIYVFSNAKLVGVVKTDESGNFACNFPTPAGLKVGEHMLQVSGYSPSQTVRDALMGIVLQADQTKGTFVIPFDFKQYDVKDKQLNILKNVVLPQGASVKILGFASSTSGEDDQRISLFRAIEVKKNLSKLIKDAKFKALGQGIKQSTLCSQYKNQCALIKISAK